MLKFYTLADMAGLPHSFTFTVQQWQRRTNAGKKKKSNKAAAPSHMCPLNLSLVVQSRSWGQRNHHTFCSLLSCNICQHFRTGGVVHQTSHGAFSHGHSISAEVRKPLLFPLTPPRTSRNSRSRATRNESCPFQPLCRRASC